MQFFFFVVLEANVGILAAGRFDVFEFDFLDLARARGRLARLGLVGGETAHEVLQLGHFLLCLGVGGEQLLAHLGRGKHVIVVVARIDAQAPVVHVCHVGAHAVQEVPVVGNDEHGRAARVQHALKPADRIDVQVIGRLVQQHDVGIGEQYLRQQHAQLPARRNRAHRTKVLFDRNAHAMQQLACARLGGIAAEFGVARLQIGRAHIVLFASVRIGIDGVALGHRLPHFFVPHQHHVEHALVLVRELILAQLAHPLVALDRD